MSYLKSIESVREKNRLNKEKIEVWIWKIVLGMMLIGTAYLLIPKNLGTLVAETTKVYIDIDELYYSAEANRVLHKTHSTYVTDEVYAEIIDLLSAYHYHGFWNALWDNHTGSIDIYYITNESGKGFAIDNQGKFFLKRNGKQCVYYLDWFGRSEALKLYSEIQQLLEKQ